MSTKSLPPILLLFLVGAGVATAQQQMTPEQAQSILRGTGSDAVCQRLLQSGQGQAEVRARLRAAGYPSNLLDACFSPGGATAAQDAAAARAVARLGIVTTVTGGDSLTARLLRDSLRLDSLLREESFERVARLVIFGLGVFRQPTTRFQPLVTGPVDEGYRLGPGDGLVLLLTGAVEAAHQLEVTREGFILIPQVGQVYVANLTLRQLREALYSRLARAYSSVTRGPDSKTRFEISVAKVRVQSIRVIGEVGRPGTYEVAATGTVLTALYEAGGLTERASFRRVTVRRGTREVATVDLYDYLLGGVTPDAPLQPGDVVFVPVAGPRVKIAGEVVRPAIYELMPGESLRELLHAAGGLTALAATDAATVHRVIPPDQRTDPGRARTIVTVDLRAALDGAGTNVPLYDADSVTVFPVSEGRTNLVRISGSVWQPGAYQLRPGMRLWDLIRTAGGLRPETYAGRAHIVRTSRDSTRFMLGVALPRVATESPPENPPLQELDEVTIFARNEYRPQRYVGVYGAVPKNGLVVYSDSMTLRDAVLLSGGVREDASLLEAEVSRLREEWRGDGDSMMVVLRVSLDSSYVVDPTGPVARPVGARQSPEVPLRPYDNILIRRLTGFELPRTVVLSGEVRFPGRYTLLSRDERLRDVIQRAGGLTQQAYVNGIRFFRADPAGSQGPAAGNSGDRVQDSARARPLLMTRLGIDLPRVMRDARYKDNLVLAAGDSVHLPRFIPTVRVEGAVNAPADVTYSPGAGLKYYIEAAGGYTAQADRRNTFVQQPNGILEKGRRPEPGAVVVVPLRAQGTSNPPLILTLVPLITQLIASAATVLVVFITRP